MNIDISDNSWRVGLICGMSSKGVLVGMMRNANKRFSFTIIRARDGANDWLWGFLNEYDVELMLSL